ncbi:MAG: hypothetical protein U0325_35405 [Polyangiales bacterium]
MTVFLEVALRTLGVDPRAQSFTVKLTGGPDGDVAGNEIEILHREYGDHAKIVGIADGSGSIEDPDGIDHGELLRLVDLSEPVARFDPARLGPRGRVVPVEAPDGVRARNTLHNRVVADVFIPGGGRPQTIHSGNWRDFLLPDGTPSSRVIVEGANLHHARRAEVPRRARRGDPQGQLREQVRGDLLDFEITSSHLLTEEEFLANKPRFVAEVLVRLRELARASRPSCCSASARATRACSSRSSLCASRAR